METIYTIPVNEAFDACRISEGEKEAGRIPICPFCLLTAKCEENELDLILGASMMEPDVRIMTNRKFFCRRHYSRMLSMKNRLGLALMVQSHMAELREEILSSKIPSEGETCYICDRIEATLARMFTASAVLWARDGSFRKKAAEQEVYCIPHLARFLNAGKKEIPRREYAAFSESIRNAALRKFDGLSSDIDHFCRKFDYRYENEDWNGAKNAVERAEKLLLGDGDLRPGKGKR